MVSLALLPSLSYLILQEIGLAVVWKSAETVQAVS